MSGFGGVYRYEERKREYHTHNRKVQAEDKPEVEAIDARA